MIPVITTTEIRLIREDEFGEEIPVTVTVTGAVWADDDVIEVVLKTATDNKGGRFITSPEELRWSERTWVEDDLATAWEELNEK